MISSAMLPISGSLRGVPSPEARRQVSVPRVQSRGQPGHGATLRPVLIPGGDEVLDSRPMYKIVFFPGSML
jgi:hypothetical protein